VNVIVCVKRVPDTETRIRVDASGSGIDATGVKYVVSPYDEYALELALRAKEEKGQGEVTVLTLGDSASHETLRKALAMGADKALLLTGESRHGRPRHREGARGELEGAEAPLVLFGVKAIDDDQQQVAPMVATLLGRACVTGVASFDVADGKVVCHREVEGGAEVVEATCRPSSRSPRGRTSRGSRRSRGSWRPRRSRSRRSPPPWCLRGCACDPWRNRPRVRRDESSARDPTRFRSWCGCSAKKPKPSSQGDDPNGRRPRIRGAARRQAFRSHARGRSPWLPAGRLARRQRHVLVLGAPGGVAGADDLGRWGAAVVAVAEHDALGEYNPDGYTGVVARPRR
jgi:hypothetical protein